MDYGDYCNPLFQSTLPRRERQCLSPYFYCYNYFNPRSREGSDVFCKGENDHLNISIHAPAKGATRGRLRTSAPFEIFQSTLPRRERHKEVTVGAKEPQFQSTLPRRERQCKEGYYNAVLDISIHAPAKGATQATPSVHQMFRNFNPRSREGSDFGTSTVSPRKKLFQSTLPRRERQYLLTSFRLQYGYSLFHLTNKI